MRRLNDRGRGVEGFDGIAKDGQGGFIGDIGLGDDDTVSDGGLFAALLMSFKLSQPVYRINR